MQDIISIILIFLLSQYFPILHEFLTVVIALDVLSTLWIFLVVIFTLVLTFSVVLYLPKIYKITCGLGTYHKLIPRTSGSTESSYFGEYDSEKIKEVFKANFVVGISLFLVLIYIFNSVPSSFFVHQNSEINQSINTSVPQKNSVAYIPSNAAFTSTLLLVPTFLLSLRLLANPTWDWIKIIVTIQISPGEQTGRSKYQAHINKL